jgi:hypothetical protein
MLNFADPLYQEVLRFVFSLGLLAAGWLVGQRLTMFWSLRQKQRENDLATARAFHLLYGEFFSIWKLWNYYRRDIGAESLPEGSRWQLLERACRAEGELEATLVRLACERKLTQSDVATLGQFRQLYQSLREVIGKNEPLAWDSSKHQKYLDFKSKAPLIASLIQGGEYLPEQASKALLEITSNKWETSR